jgi:hypothetical protein
MTQVIDLHLLFVNKPKQNIVYIVRKYENKNINKNLIYSHPLPNTDNAYKICRKKKFFKQHEIYKKKNVCVGLST